jgi:hypothetical protein
MELQALLLTKEQIAKVGDRFKLHKSKAYDQVLHLSLNGYRAFVGRGFKLVCQQYVLMFHLAYNDPLNISVFPDDDGNRKRFDLIFDCFDKLGNLASLVYMKKSKKTLKNTKRMYMVLAVNLLIPLMCFVTRLLLLLVQNQRKPLLR